MKLEKKLETLWEELIFSTVKIEVQADNSIRKGTAFCYKYVRKELGVTIVLVTNRHIIEDGENFTIYFHLQEKGNIKLGHIYSLNLPIKNWWTTHPEKTIDIAVMPMLEIYKILSSKGISIFLRCFTSEKFSDNTNLSKELDAVEDIYFIGFPNDIYD
ncbi:MAG: hypothetical protein ACTSRR_13450, partial [Candidatus Heimdallarchaeaceae archaeon]